MIQIQFLRKQGLHRQAAHLLAYWPVTRDEPGASIVEEESLMLHSELASDADEVEEAVDETEREDSADSNGDLESEPEGQGEEGSEVPVTGDCGLPVMLKLAIQEAFTSAVLKNGNAAAACEELSGFTKHVMRVNSDPTTILTDAADTSQMMSDAPAPAQSPRLVVKIRTRPRGSRRPHWEMGKGSPLELLFPCPPFCVSPFSFFTHTCMHVLACNMYYVLQYV